MRGGPTPPWWSSGAEDLDDTDPFEAHRAARARATDQDTPADGSPRRDGPFDDAAGRRRAAAGDGPGGGERPWDIPWEDWDDRDPPPPHGAQRSTVDDAIDAVQALARFVASRRGGRSGVRPHGRDQTCRACPWCIALRSLGDARPEVVDHLDEALRHIVAAARAWVDAAESRGQWQRIPLDDEDDERDGPARG